LAGSKEHQKVLQRLRNEHKRHIRRTVDLGFLPESEAWALFEGSSGWEMGQGGKVPVGPSKKPATHGDVKTALPDLSPVIVLPGDKDLAMFAVFSCQAFPSLPVTALATKLHPSSK
jgi:hypothetical protein